MSDKDWQKLSRESDLKEGVLSVFDLGKGKVVAVRHDGAIHVCEGKCTHYGAPLEQGFLRGHILTCAWHNARFDLKTGEMKAAPALDHLKGYETKVEDGNVYIRPAIRAKPATKLETAHLIFVIIGAGAAGNAAAETLRDEGFSGRVILVSPEDDLPYDRPNLSKDFLAGKAKPEWIPLRSQKFYAEQNIEFIKGRKAIAVDAGAHTVTLDGGEKLLWDRLLLATGSRPRPLDIPGEDMKGVFLLRSRRDSEKIVNALEGARKAAVIGASFIGLEVAAALRQRKLDVRVIAPEMIPLGKVFGDKIGIWLRGLHESQGVQFFMGRKPIEVVGSGSVEGVRLDDGTVVSADLVVAGIGVTPVLEYLSETGIVKQNSVPVDSHLQTSVAGVFAAGDIAAVPYAPLNRRIRVEHWVVAERQGQHAARAMLGLMKPYNEAPFFWTRQYDMSLCYMGWAGSFDRIAYRGTIGKEGMLAGYFEKDRLQAAASLRGNTELNILGELLKAGAAVSYEQFEDEKLELRTLLPNNP
jgi:NADPH-dependent 2,4-dienoyl-CoA reductase/sulfur reductase-like enzyme/nitrite reductase/ring-hydroxylating ferredoxin subunit